eukprot:5718274-Amphidinium_carterae.1
MEGNKLLEQRGIKLWWYKRKQCSKALETEHLWKMLFVFCVDGSLSFYFARSFAHEDQRYDRPYFHVDSSGPPTHRSKGTEVAVHDST